MKDRKCFKCKKDIYYNDFHFHYLDEFPIELNETNNWYADVEDYWLDHADRELDCEDVWNESRVEILCCKCLKEEDEKR